MDNNYKKQIYEILEEEGRELHYKEIARRIALYKRDVPRTDFAGIINKTLRNSPDLFEPLGQGYYQLIR